VPEASRDTSSGTFGKKMKTPLRLFLVLAAVQSLAFAGGGSEDVVADLNGWKLRIGGGGGSEAYIERESNGVHFHGRIKFQQFWDYFLILKELPRSPDNKPTKIWIVDENNRNEPNPSYLDPERALPILQLMLLTHRANLTSNASEALEKELNLHSPLPKSLQPNANFRFIVMTEGAEQASGGNGGQRR
jgi:hypothetical protein